MLVILKLAYVTVPIMTGSFHSINGRRTRHLLYAYSSVRFTQENYLISLRKILWFVCKVITHVSCSHSGR